MLYYKLIILKAEFNDSSIIVMFILKFSCLFHSSFIPSNFFFFLRLHDSYHFRLGCSKGRDWGSKENLATWHNIFKYDFWFLVWHIKSLEVINSSLIIIQKNTATEVTGQTAAPKLDREMDTDNQSLPGAEAHSWSQYPLWWKGHLFLVLVIEVLVGLHRTFNFSFFGWGIDLDYCNI